VFALVLGFLAVAAIGATLGWTLTDTSNGTPLTSPSLSASVPTSQTPSPKPTPSVTQTKTTAPPNGLVVPNFAAMGTSFIDARAQLKAQKIQGVPVFSSSGNGNDTVVKTSPAAGQPMRKGDTITLYVNEPAPQLDVPNEVGKSCRSAASDLAATGFRVAYATSDRSGPVQSQNPDSTSQTAHWNDTVTLTCGATQTSPSASASSSSQPNGEPSGPPN
jgi:beta-lactam-binding protein with PASTA domain